MHYVSDWHVVSLALGRQNLGASLLRARFVPLWDAVPNCICMRIHAACSTCRAPMLASELDALARRSLGVRQTCNMADQSELVAQNCHFTPVAVLRGRAVCCGRTRGGRAAWAGRWAAGRSWSHLCILGGGAVLCRRVHMHCAARKGHAPLLRWLLSTSSLRRHRSPTGAQLLMQDPLEPDCAPHVVPAVQSH